MDPQHSEDEIRKRCRELVYQVAYAFYDAPFIIIMHLLIHHEVATESSIASWITLPVPETRRYLGTLKTHKLIKLYVNKEKVKLPEYQIKPGDPITARYRMKEVSYYYIDYREFANMTKYRLAMMRSNTESQMLEDVAHKGYKCPHCNRRYDPLDLAHLFDPRSNTFQCEDDRTELEEVDPEREAAEAAAAAAAASATGGAGVDANGNPVVNGNNGNDPAAAAAAPRDKLQRFNAAITPIRDALRDVDGVTIPSLNIAVWIAKNVRTEVLVADDEKEQGERITVVLGGEDERERVEKERQAEAQRVQNALPIWYTHSTVTGSATALGIKDQVRNAELAAAAGGGVAKGGAEGDDDMLMMHYEGMYGDDEGVEDGIGVGISGNGQEGQGEGEGETEGEAAGSGLDGQALAVLKGRTSLGAGEGGDGDGEDDVAMIGDDAGEKISGVGNDNGNGAGSGSGLGSGSRSGTVNDTKEQVAYQGALTLPGTSSSGDRKMVKVNGVDKPVDEITDEDQELMTSDEYQTYYEVALS